MKNNTDSLLIHRISLEEGKRLTMTGVTDVDNFNDKVLLVYTSMGELTVRGRNIRVESFGNEDGELTAVGDIRALIYGDRDKRSKIGFFRKLTR